MFILVWGWSSCSQLIISPWGLTHILNSTCLKWFSLPFTPWSCSWLWCRLAWPCAWTLARLAKAMSMSWAIWIAFRPLSTDKHASIWSSNSIKINIVHRSNLLTWSESSCLTLYCRWSEVIWQLLMMGSLGIRRKMMHLLSTIRLSTAKMILNNL